MPLDNLVNARGEGTSDASQTSHQRPQAQCPALSPFTMTKIDKADRAEKGTDVKDL
ncbi:hypothetical protein O9929_05450 [Vibrio lentus]|nr:hypothetical protein [Vibrio lentus]